MAKEKMFLGREESPLGPITLLSDEEGLLGLWFDGQQHYGEGYRLEEAIEAVPGEVPPIDLAREWLRSYFSGEKPGQDVPLHLEGTAFQRRVWEALRDIPYGETSSYGELARQLGCGAARPVGQAVGRNPVSLIVPCHRVLGKGGSMTGYAGGIERKRWLLDLEKGEERGPVPGLS